jgi:DNA-binding CsgD family transcriptional regulator
LAEVVFTFLAPAPLFTYMDLIIAYNALLLLLLILYIFTKSNIFYRDETRTIILFTVFLLCILISDNFFLDKSYHDLQLVQFACIFYITGVSILHIKRIVKVIENEKKLTQAFQETNVLLAEQKQGLEEIVEKRTTQLLDIEKKSHELEMKMKENDLNMLSASNMLKYQFSKNLIEELNELPKQDKELKIALNALINKLKSQVALEERVDMLHKDMLRVNAEFYDRMHTRFPDLSKTERELCAFIKLNLSNKDIAELRKTTLNTINVTRSRLRKKLGLTRDEELESFIQQI